jgi:hypothetical protein
MDNLYLVHTAVFKIKSPEHGCVVEIGPLPLAEGSEKTCALEIDIKNFSNTMGFLIRDIPLFLDTDAKERRFSLTLKRAA